MKKIEEITGQEFAGLLLKGKDLPTGRDDPQFNVIGAVDLRGKKIRGPRVAYAVRFRGPVDFRDVTVQGTLDLTSCVFEDSTLRFDDAEIEGSLELGGISAPAVSMIGIVVGGHLSLNSARVRNRNRAIRDGHINIQDGRINGFLDLRGISANIVLLNGSRVQGDMHLGCGLEGSKQPSRIDSIYAQGLEVFGSVMVNGIGVTENRSDEAMAQETSAPEMILPNARIHGSLSLMPYRIGQSEEIWSNLSSIDLSGAVIEGNAIFTGCQIRGYLNLSNAKIQGNVTISSIEDDESQERMSIGYIQVLWTHIEGYLWVRGVGIRDSCELSSSTVGGTIAFESLDSHRTEIGGKLELSGVQCSSHLDFAGIRVGGEIRMLSAKTGPVSFGVGTISELEKSSGAASAMPVDSARTFTSVVIPCQAQRLMLTNTRITGSLNLSHIQIFGFESSFGRRGLIIEDCQITGSLMLWKIGAFRDAVRTDKAAMIEIKPWDFSAAIVGDLRIRRCQIKGDCVLTFAKVSGGIDLRDSVISGDLKAASTISTHDATDQDPELVGELKKLSPMNPQLNLQYRATCREFQMRMLRCENDIDISGLTIVADPEDPNTNPGGLDARYIEVKGDLLAYLPQEETRSISDKDEAFAEIPGCLNLSYAKIARLVVSAHSFPVPEREDRDPREADPLFEGIVFVRAQIGKLEIPKIRRDSWTYPVPINLEDISVEVWEIGEKSPEQYIALLKNDRQIRRSTYRAIEENLRNSGQDDQADKVYCAMQDRDWQEKWPQLKRSMRELKSWWNRPQRLRQFLREGLRYLFAPFFYLFALPFHYLFKGVLQYGTNPGRLGFAILLLALLSLPVYRNPANFEASLSLLASDPSRFSSNNSNAPDFQPSYGASPSSADWGWDDALAMMLRYHVPVAPLAIRSDWDARDDPCLSYGGTSGCESLDQEDGPLFKIHFLAPEDFTNLMQLLNWIFWPLLLTFWIRRLLRQ
jgi:hypothetical protein